MRCPVHAMCCGPPSNSPLSTTAGSREADSITPSLLTGRSQQAYLEKMCPGRRRPALRRGSADDGARCRRVWGEHPLCHGWFRPVPPGGGARPRSRRPLDSQEGVHVAGRGRHCQGRGGTAATAAWVCCWERGEGYRWRPPVGSVRYRLSLPLLAGPTLGWGRPSPL